MWIPGPTKGGVGSGSGEHRGAGQAPLPPLLGPHLAPQGFVPPLGKIAALLRPGSPTGFPGIRRLFFTEREGWEAGALPAPFPMRFCTLFS